MTVENHVLEIGTLWIKITIIDENEKIYSICDTANDQYINTDVRYGTGRKYVIVYDCYCVQHAIEEFLEKTATRSERISKLDLGE